MYRTTWTLLYQPRTTPKVAARPATWHWSQGSKIVWSMENTKVDVYQSPPPTPFFGEVKWREICVALWQLEISVFIGGWREMEGVCKDDWFFWLQISYFPPTWKIKNTQFLLFCFDADTCWQEIVMCCLPPFPVVGPGCSPTLPTAHLIQIPSQKSKDKSVHQQHQQHLSHGRIVNGLVDVGPSHSWNRKQQTTHQIWRRETSVISLKVLISKRWQERFYHVA